MKKVLVIAIAVLALVICLVIAHRADQNTKVPSSNPTSTTNGSDATSPDSVPATPVPAPSDIENGLGWG